MTKYEDGWPVKDFITIWMRNKTAYKKRKVDGKIKKVNMV